MLKEENKKSDSSRGMLVQRYSRPLVVFLGERLLWSCMKINSLFLPWRAESSS